MTTVKKEPKACKTESYKERFLNQEADVEKYVLEQLLRRKLIHD
jgi:hypothetical protein